MQTETGDDKRDMNAKGEEKQGIEQRYSLRKKYVCHISVDDSDDDSCTKSEEKL